MNDSESDRCPSKSELERFASGRIEQANQERLTNHLSKCDFCGETIDAMRLSEDTLVEVLRDLKPDTEFLDEPELQQGIETLRNRPEATVVDLDETALSVSPATPNARPGKSDPARPRPKSALDRPEMLGSYRLVSKLGQGGMGAVYKAIHTQLDKTVAIKVLASGRFGDANSTQRFKREMKALGRVQHPNIVVAHDGGEINHEHFLVMEYVDGEDIAAFDRNHKDLPVSVACEIIRQAAIGLQHAHDQGLIHRDIKPGNLILDRDGVVKVLDLGLARINEVQSPSIDEATGEHPTDITAVGTAMGTVAYMSPEQALDSSKVDHRADLYSLGISLYKLLAGSLPFSSDTHDTHGKMLIAIMTKTSPSLSTFRPDLPQDLVTVVDRMLAKKPGDRIATAGQFAKELAPFAGASLAGLANLPKGKLPDSVLDDLPTVAPSSSKPKRWGLVATGLLITSLLLFAAVQTFWVKTENGMLLVEIADEQVEARLKTNGISVIDQRNDRVWEIQAQTKTPKSLPAGKYGFEIPAGLLITDAQGLEIRSNELRLVDKNKHLRIRVSLADGDDANQVKQQSQFRPEFAGSEGIEFSSKVVAGYATEREYRLNFTVQRTSDLSQALCIRFPVAEKNAVIATIGGFPKSYPRGTSTFEFCDQTGNEKMASRVNTNPLWDGQPHELEMVVREGIIKLNVDGASLLETTLDQHGMRPDLWMQKAWNDNGIDRAVYFVAPVEATSFRVSNFSVTPLAPDARSSSQPHVKSSISPPQALFELISSYDGTIRFRTSQSAKATKAKRWNDLDRELKALEVNANSNKEFDDEALSQAAELLNQMDLKQCRLELNLASTSVSSRGLMSLRGLTIRHLDTVQSCFDLGENENEISQLSVESWNMGGGADYKDIEAVASIPSIKSINIDINPGVESPENLNRKLLALVQSKATSVRIGSWGEPSNLGKAQLELVMKMKAKNLSIAPFLDVTPAIRVELIADRLRDGHEIDGIVSAAATLPDEFVMEFDAIRTSTKPEGIGIVFRFGEHLGQVILGGWDGTLSAIEQVNGRLGGEQENPIKVAFDPFKDGKAHRVRIEVFHHAIGVQTDGYYRLWWHGDPSSITHFLKGKQSSLGEAFLIAHNGASFRVSNFSVNPLSADASDQSPPGSQSLWQEANSLVKKMRGTISVGPYGMTLPIDQHLNRVPSDLPVHFGFRGKKGFDDANAAALRKMIDRLPPFRFEALDLTETSITADGLLQFDSLHPNFVMLGKTAATLDIDPIADQLAKWRTHTWEFGESIGADGLAAFAKHSNAGVYTVSAKRISPESLTALGQSKATSVAVRFGADEIDDYVPALLKLPQLSYLHLLDCKRPTDEQVAALRQIHSDTRIFWNKDLIASSVPALSDKDILDFLREKGRRVTLGPKPLSGTSLTAMRMPPALGTGLLHFDFRNGKHNEGTRFGDRELKRIGELLRSRPDIRIGLMCLKGASITNQGLLALHDIPMQEVHVYLTKTDCDAIAATLADFPISDWDFGPLMSPDGLSKFLGNPHLRGISLVSRNLTADSFRQLAKRKVSRLQIWGDESREFTLVSELRKFSSLTDLYLPSYRLSPVEQQELRAALPNVTVHFKSYSDRVPPTPNQREIDPEITAAKWIESVGGKMHNGSPFGAVMNSQQVTSKPGSLRFVDLSGLGDIRGVGQNLANLPNLEVLFADDTSLDSDDLSGILTNPNIYWVKFARTQLKSKDFRRLSALPRLNSLGLDWSQVDDDWAFMKEIPWLPEIQLSATEAPQFDSLCKHQQLDTVWLAIDYQKSQTNESKLMAIAAKAVVRNPLLRIGINNKIVGTDPVKATAKRLASEGWKLSGAHSNWRDAWDSTADDAWKRKDWFHARDIIAPDNLRLKSELLESLPALGHAFNKVQFRGATNLEGLPNYLRSRVVTHVDLSGSELNDAMLQEIANMSGVANLNIVDTQVTAQAVEAFRKARPNCKVSANPPIVDPPAFDPNRPNSTILGAHQKIQVAPSVPREYELKFSLKRDSGNEGALLVQIPVLDQRATVVLSGYAKTRSGLSLIDGAEAYNNETRRNGDPFVDGKVHHVVVRVTENSVFTSVDGETLIDWKGKMSRLSMPSWANKKSLVITAGQETRFQISDVTLKDVSTQ